MINFPKSAVVLLSLLALLLFPDLATGQVRLGPVLGFHSGKLNIDPPFADQVRENRNGIAAGVLVIIPIIPFLTVQIEPTFVSRGDHFTEEGVADGLPFTTRSATNLSYLDIPVMARLELPEGPIRPYLVAGVGPALLVGAVITVDEIVIEGQVTELNNSETDVKDQFSSSEMAAHLGGGFSVPMRNYHLHMAFMYVKGLSNINEARDFDIDVKNEGWQVKLGFTVPVRER